MTPIGKCISKRSICSIASILAVLVGGVIWWQAKEGATSGATDPAPDTGVHRLTGGSGVDISDIAGRSSNPKVRELSNKLAKEFEQDPSILATRLADADHKDLAYDIGRDLIAMFPDKANELMAGFKATRPPELASSLCGSLVASVATRGNSHEALDLADGLGAGRNRTFAFTELAGSLSSGDYGKILEKVRAEGLPEDARRLEAGLMSRAAKFPVKDLESLMALELSPETSNAVRSAYGAQLVAEKGRAAALQTALALPADLQAGAIYGVLNRGASEDGGRTWLLESLSSMDPQIKLDRSTLTTGVAQQMLQQSGASAMDWALSIPNPTLRDATVSGAMRSWLEMNSMEASDWLGKQPAGSAKDAAISDVAKFLSAHGDLNAARAWLPQMQDAGKKRVLEKDIQSLAEGASR